MGCPNSSRPRVASKREEGEEKRSISKAIVGARVFEPGTRPFFKSAMSLVFRRYRRGIQRLSPALRVHRAPPPSSGIDPVLGEILETAACIRSAGGFVLGTHQVGKRFVFGQTFASPIPVEVPRATPCGCVDGLLGPVLDGQPVDLREVPVA
jgi:hypothetical protein